MSTFATETVLQHAAALRTLVDRGALVVVNHSGGKDSQALYAVIRSIVPDNQIYVVHADLGDVEWPGVKDHIRANIEHPLAIAQAIYKDGSTKTLLDMVERRGMWPSAGQRYCTSDLKRGPCNKVIRAEAERRGTKLVVSCFGFRAKESAARAKRPTWQRNERMSKAGRDWFEFAPLHDISEADVWRIIAASGQQRHWAYDAGMSRLSCCFCILGSRADLATAARLRPGLLARYAELEQRIDHTMRHGESLGDMIPARERAA